MELVSRLSISGHRLAMGKELSKPNSNSGRAVCSDYHGKAALDPPGSFNKVFTNSASAFVSSSG